MIFVTVGTQLPFDRLVRAVDAWTGRKGRDDVFAQIARGGYRPRHLRWAEFLGADECQRKLAEADAIIAHAGMGSILTALELGKPILVMPRRVELGEHRNDHQSATIARLHGRTGILVAEHEQEVPERMEELMALGLRKQIPAQASPQLLRALRQFVTGAAGIQEEEYAELPLGEYAVAGGGLSLGSVHPMAAASAE